MSGAADLVDSITADIRSGRLALGDRLPGTRELAKTLDLNRKTVVAAFAELEAEGWVRLRAGSGAFVAATVDAAARTARPSPRAAFPLPPLVQTGKEAMWPLPSHPPLLRMSGGQPDLRVLPLDSLARAWRRALAGTGRALVDYADTAGEPTLLAALSDWLAETRGVRPSPGGIIVTRGSQGALYLLARAVLRPGDRVAVESFGYGPAWAVFRQAGLDVVPVPVDEAGVDVEALSRLASIRAVYLTPHHQYPTGAVLSPSRRARLLNLAAERQWMVIEDDYDHEFHYVGRPVLPLASADTRGTVAYVGTLSKALAPGLRVGFAVAPPPVIERLSAYRRLVDRQGDHVTERAVAELILDGSLGRHIRRSRRVYQRRRATLLAALGASFGDRLVPNDPPGGMALWVHAPGVDVDAWASRARGQGVEFTTAREYAFDHVPRPFVRLGFACLDETEIVEAVGRMRRGW